MGEAEVIEVGQKVENGLAVKDYRIELVVREGAIPFTEEHLLRAQPIIEFFWSLDPHTVRKYIEIQSINAPGLRWYNRFDINGANTFATNSTNFGILFTNRGMNSDLPHRVSPTTNKQDKGFIDNFSGTLAHELTHGCEDFPKLFPDSEFNRRFLLEWQKKFGWRSVFQTIQDENGMWSLSDRPMPGWMKNSEGKWQSGDYIIVGTMFTSMPEKCIGGKNSYSSSVHFGEDICDSMAAYVLSSTLLHTEKREFLEETIAEYKSLRKQ